MGGKGLLPCWPFQSALLVTVYFYTFLAFLASGELVYFLVTSIACSLCLLEMLLWRGIIILMGNGDSPWHCVTAGLLSLLVFHLEAVRTFQPGMN